MEVMASAWPPLSCIAGVVQGRSDHLGAGQAGQQSSGASRGRLDLRDRIRAARLALLAGGDCSRLHAEPWACLAGGLPFKDRLLETLYQCS